MAASIRHSSVALMVLLVALQGEAHTQTYLSWQRHSLSVSALLQANWCNTSLATSLCLCVPPLSLSVTTTTTMTHTRVLPPCSSLNIGSPAARPHIHSPPASPDAVWRQSDRVWLRLPLEVPLTHEGLGCTAVRGIQPKGVFGWVGMGSREQRCAPRMSLSWLAD